MPDSDPTTWLTAQAAADRLGVSMRTLARLDADGATRPRQRTERDHRRYDPAQLDELLQSWASTTD